MLEEWIALHKQELIEDIRSLVEIPSVAKPGSEEDALYGRECKRAGEVMLSLAEKYGFLGENCQGRCIRIPFGTGKRRVEIWNHLDVVPEGEGWMYPPFACTERNGFLIGRGVSDNKGPAVAVLYAMRYLKEQGVSLSYALSQVCGLCEETGMEDAAWYVEKYGSPEFAVIADCRFPLCYGEKGRCLVKLSCERNLPHIREISAGVVSNSVADSAKALIQGKEECISFSAKGLAGHAAAPEKCINPIGILADMVQKSEDLALTKEEKLFFAFLKKSGSDGYGEGLGIAGEDKIFGKITCAATVLSMGRGKVFLEFDLRFPPKTDITKIVKKIERTALEYGFSLERSTHTKGYMQSLEKQEIRALLSSYREEYGDVGEPYVMGGNTYARFFKNGTGFGPGIPRSAVTDREQETLLTALCLPEGHGGGHACDEVLSVAGLCKAIKIYVNAFIRLEKIYGGEA